MKAQSKKYFMESQKPSTPFRQLSITHHKSNQRTWFLTTAGGARGGYRGVGRRRLRGWAPADARLRVGGKGSGCAWGNEGKKRNEGLGLEDGIYTSTG